VVKVAALIAGLVSLMVYSVLLILAYLYSRSIVAPLSRKFSMNVILSGLLAVAASIVVIIDAVTGKVLWWLEAALFLVSYVLLMVSVIHYLRLSSRVLSGSKEREEYGERGPLIGGFSVTPKELPKLTPLCGMFKTKIYIGRSKNPTVCDFDRRIWLSRIEAADSVDPAKLHVILESVIRTISEGGGSGLVLLDGIEYLLLHNDFRSVVKFLASLKDYMLLSNSAVVVVLDEETLGEREISVIRREFPPLEIEKLLSSLEKHALFGALSREDLKE